tara:strand:- start:89 stop:328 length:240 start_codon:yes stop_codon:yes gene_type:complete
MTNEFLKVEGNDGLVRDTSNNAIINTNSIEYQNYINRKNIMMNKDSEIDSQRKDIDLIKSDMKDIKDLLMSFINSIKQE